MSLHPSSSSPKPFLLTDSRQVISPANSIFFAIEGDRHDGHDYIPNLYQQGVRHFITEKPVLGHYPEAIVEQVEHSISTLQRLATAHRNQFNLPVIGITGSNGKTTIKEWLYELLEPDYVIVKSPKSYNSQIGVPLSIWEIGDAHQLGIFEAGISTTQEMEQLASIIQPNIGIFTNLGTAHQEGFESLEHKAMEKVKLFQQCGCLIYCHDHSIVHQAAQTISCEKFTWGEHEQAHLRICAKQVQEQETTIQFRYQQQQFAITFPFTNRASLENVIHCVACLLHLNTSIHHIQERIAKLHNVAMRLVLKQGIQQCLLIDDTYNNDLAGVAVALDFMDQQDDTKPRTAILSDILEAGNGLDQVYTQLNQLLVARQVTRLIGIGTTISEHAQAFQMSTRFFPSVADFFQATCEFNNELILIKGARSFGLEKITDSLQQKVHGTRLEINLEALAHNLNVYRSLLAPSTKIMVMVKAFAYGSGGYEVARLLQYHRVDYLAVAYADEGVELREKGIKLPIMVMNPSPESFQKIIDYQLEPEIYSFRILHSLVDFLKTLSQPQSNIPIHLKLDTGMHRLGFEQSDLAQLLPILITHYQLVIKSAFTHLAGADDSIHREFSLQQLSAYQEMTNFLEKTLNYSFIKHALNSPGITRFPGYQYNMVRLGIGLYGVDTNHRYQQQLQLVGTLKTTISQIRQLKIGETVGYGRMGKVDKPTTIAVIAIGYADGYDRRFSNAKGKVLVNGQIAYVIGNVCMDMTMIDISEINAKEGDEVIIFGQTPTIMELAKAIGTIPYELLTNVSDRVKRIFYKE